MSQSAAMHHPNPLLPREAQATGPGFALAMLVHLLLIAAIALGVNWRSSEPAGVEAELWAAVPQIAAPRAVEPEPQTPPPRPPTPQPKVETPPRPVPDAQIAIEKAKREEKLKAQKEEQEKQEKLRADKQETDRKKKAEEQTRAEQLEAQRQANLKRILGQAGATGDNPGGTAAQTAGPSASYAGRIRARILPNIVFTDTVNGDPTAEVEVRVGPDGTILGRKLVRSSGVPAWDDAVLRAIDRTEVLPRDVDGRVPPTMLLQFSPNRR